MFRFLSVFGAVDAVSFVAEAEFDCVSERSADRCSPGAAFHAGGVWSGVGATDSVLGSRFGSSFDRHGGCSFAWS